AMQRQRHFVALAKAVINHHFCYFPELKALSGRHLLYPTLLLIFRLPEVGLLQYLENSVLYPEPMNAVLLKEDSHPIHLLNESGLPEGFYSSVASLKVIETGEY